MIQSFYLKREGERAKIYLVGHNWCEACGETLKYQAVVHAVWRNSQEMRLTILCTHCAEDEKKLPVTLPTWRTHHFIALITPKRPIKSVPYFFICPEYTNGTVSVFEAAISNKGIQSDTSGVIIIDKTVHTVREDQLLLTGKEKKRLR